MGDKWKEEVLFLGLGRDGVSHYRNYLPATRGGYDYVQQDTDGSIIFESVRRRDHPVVVYQMPFHEFQCDQMIRMKRHGATVVLNVDDSLRGVARMGQDHGLSHHFGEDLLKMHEKMIQVADHLIVSTQWLYDHYDHPSSFICRNGLDLGRYRQRPRVFPFDITIGWAGGTGHEAPMREISDAVREFVLETDGVGMAIVGEPRMPAILGLPSEKFVHVPWSDLYHYPSAIRGFDIGLAPALRHDFFRAKSELRFYEYGAAGVAGVYSPVTYDVEAGGEAGQLLAHTPGEWYVALDKLFDREYRLSQADKAREYVDENVDMDVRVGEWDDALEQIVCG